MNREKKTELSFCIGMVLYQEVEDDIGQKREDGNAKRVKVEQNRRGKDKE